jgi:NAD(P)-dependent dehydrogenase (short-subunit alcohol dehydrogenase family)
MKIDGSVALVTGANRGLGRAYARELVKRGAAKVYGAARDPAGVTLTNGVRLELHHQGTLVVAVHASFIDTDMAALVTGPKDSPESVAQQAFDAVEAGRVEVLADERTRTVKAQLSRDHELIYPPVQEFWDAAVGGTS